MALTFQPFGLSMVEHKGGKPNYPVTRYPLAPGYGEGTSLNFGQGDVMCISASTANPGLVYYQENTATTVGANSDYLVAGVFDAVQYTAQNGTVTQSRYWAGGTPVFNGYNTVDSSGTDVMVTLNDLPYIVYKVQCNAPLQSNGAYFSNYNLTTNGGTYTPTNAPSAGWLGANPVTNQSTQAVNVAAGVIDVNEFGGSVKIVGLAPASDAGGTNNWDDPYPIVYVTINGSVFNFSTPSAGIPA